MSVRCVCLCTYVVEEDAESFPPKPWESGQASVTFAIPSPLLPPQNQFLPILLGSNPPHSFAHSRKYGLSPPRALPASSLHPDRSVEFGLRSTHSEPSGPLNPSGGCFPRSKMHNWNRHNHIAGRIPTKSGFLLGWGRARRTSHFSVESVQLSVLLATRPSG